MNIHDAISAMVRRDETDKGTLTLGEVMDALRSLPGHWDTFMDGLPCPVAVDLAAKITARDARRDAQKSELIRVVHDVVAQRAQTPFLDEFVARGVNVHFEAMSNAQFWIGVDFDDGTKWSINCGAVNPNAKGYAFAEQDSP